MRIGLFVPCFIDAFAPEVGIATLELLERFGLDVTYPRDQTCCAQPMANAGCHDDARGAEALFAQNFAGYDHIVTPSGSCAHHVYLPASEHRGAARRSARHQDADRSRVPSK